MIITVFGSSHGVPEKNRKCTCLQVELGENRYFFDMGTAAIEKLRDIEADIGSVKGIFVSHYHGDHMNGLISFVDLITWYFKEKRIFIYLEKVSRERKWM